MTILLLFVILFSQVILVILIEFPTEYCNDFNSTINDNSYYNNSNKEWYLPQNKIVHPIFWGFKAADKWSDIVALWDAIGESFSCAICGSDGESNGDTEHKPGEDPFYDGEVQWKWVGIIDGAAPEQWHGVLGENLLE